MQHVLQGTATRLDQHLGAAVSRNQSSGKGKENVGQKMIDADVLIANIFLPSIFLPFISSRMTADDADTRG